jgi:hypothetical protein
MTRILTKASVFSQLVLATTLAVMFPQSVSAIDNSVFGTIDAPPGVSAFNSAAPGGIGLIPFISVLIRIATIVAGLYVLFNFLTAGYDYITAGDTKANQKVREKLTMSIIGLIIIVASYTLVALLSYILFGNPAYILSPTLTGPTAE